MSEHNPPVPAPELVHPLEVYVVRPRRKRYWLHLLLLLITFFTTLTVGARLQFNFNHDVPTFSAAEDALPLFPLGWVLHDPQALMLGLPFSLTLMGILLAHEMGHYIYCQRYGVQATLPYFIPAPTLIGTLGAFIRIRSRIHSRAALFDIGIAGPIAGFLVALPVLLLSLPLSKNALPPSPDDLQFGVPLIFHIAHLLEQPFSTILAQPMSDLRFHPVAMAAWVGMFATSLNLLPGGQLDGGHIVYSVAPRDHKRISRLTILALIPMAIFFWLGWLLWAAMLFITGMRHPAVPVWPELDVPRRKFALIAVALLVLTLIPAPINQSLLDLIRELRAH